MLLYTNLQDVNLVICSAAAIVWTCLAAFRLIKHIRNILALNWKDYAIHHALCQ